MKSGVSLPSSYLSSCLKAGSLLVRGAPSYPGYSSLFYLLCWVGCFSELSWATEGAGWERLSGSLCWIWLLRAFSKSLPFCDDILLLSAWCDIWYECHWFFIRTGVGLQINVEVNDWSLFVSSIFECYNVDRHINKLWEVNRLIMLSQDHRLLLQRHLKPLLKSRRWSAASSGKKKLWKYSVWFTRCWWWDWQPMLWRDGPDTGENG